jgi:hypothetical protein
MFYRGKSLFSPQVNVLLLTVEICPKCPAILAGVPDESKLRCPPLSHLKIFSGFVLHLIFFLVPMLSLFNIHQFLPILLYIAFSISPLCTFLLFLRTSRRGLSPSIPPPFTFFSISRTIIYLSSFHFSLGTVS